MLRSSWVVAALLAGGGGAWACSPAEPGQAATPGSDAGIDRTPVPDAALDHAPHPDAADDSDGTGDAGGTDGEAGPSDGFEPRDGLDPGGRGRRIGSAFYTAGQTLLSDGSGSSWLLWRSYPDPDFSSQRVHLDHFDAAGRFVRSSPLGALNPDDVALHGDGSLSAWKNRCGALQADTCFHHQAPGTPIREVTWPASRRTATRYEVDWDGNVERPVTGDFDDRRLSFAIGAGSGLFAVTAHGGYVMNRLNAEYAPLWSAPLWPAIIPPPLPPDAPIEDILRATDLVQQVPARPVAAEGGVVIAAAVGRATLAALKASHGLDLPLPTDLRCPDVLVARVPDGGPAQLFAISTPECESLPKLAVVGRHAVVASVLRTPKPPEPNDTFQYDIGLSILDLTTGNLVTRRIAFEEDDWVQAVVPCGSERVCLAGLTGSKSVDTGSTVSYAKGFVLPVSLTGEPGALWSLTTPRHSEVQHLLPAPGGVLFFAAVNAPITHTADNDPWLGFNEGLLGVIEGI